MKVQDMVFPKTLKEFGYDFNADGRLRKLDPDTGLITNDGYEFNVSSDYNDNQKRYEALGEIITEYVYKLLEQEGLERFPVPIKTCSSLNDPNPPKSFIFGSKDVLKNDKLIILIHGSGVVRAGQWSRRLIINDSLFTGTQIPYIKKTKELGYGVLVFNTNDNSRRIGARMHDIPGSANPHNHFKTAWYDYIESCEAKHIAIIAHSYGGECVVQFATDFPDDFKRKVFAVALTDSYHQLASRDMEYMKNVSRNWIRSEERIDTPVTWSHPSTQIDRVSAGTTVHEMTSFTSMESVFKFIQNRYELSCQK